nr:hypothetical protein [uncultured archaeon]
MPSHNAPEELPPEAIELYEKHAKRPSERRFTGSKVDITNVHVPRHLPADKAGHAAEKKEVDVEAVESRPLFASVELKKHPKRKKTSMHLGRKERTILLSLLGVAIVATVLAGFIFLPSAKIALTLQTAPLLVDQKLTVSSNAAAIPNAIPGSPFIQELNVQGSSPVTSTEFVGSKAKGAVQLVNKTFDEQKIKEKSRLVTKDGTLFYMSGSANIPGGSSGGVGGVSVQVEAAEAGPKGNITAQRLDFAALDASAQTLVYGQSQGTFTGGTGDQVKVIKEADIEAAKTAAGVQAKIQAEQAARAQLQKGWVILEESWDSKVSEFTPTGKAGDKVDSIPYTAKVSVRVMAFKEEALTTALQNALKERLDENYMLFPGPLSYTKSVEAADWDKGEANITARVTHTTIPTLSIETLTDKLAGRKKAEAAAYLQGLPGVQFATIDLWPFWVQSIPEIQKRVDISIKSDREL